MELKDLEGIQSLDAVDYGETLSSDVYYGGRTVNVLRMRLCGVIYVCEEDPDDGYRSSMSSLRVDDPRERPMKNVFGHVLVRCEHRTFTGDKYSSGCDILRIYDIANDKLVLEVGTDNTDDYYPSYVANWNPENLHINEGVKDAAET